MAENTETARTSQTSETWDIEMGSDLSRASTAERPSSRPTSRMPDGADLARLTTLSRSNTIRMTTDAFEKLYLSPRNPVKGDLRQMFGVPTPIALIGFLIGAGPLGVALMGWRGAGGDGVATIGVSYFFGGMLQMIGGFMEWIMGNTFPFVTFSTFGAFFLAYAATQDPRFAAKESFLQAYNATTPEEIEEAAGHYLASIGFFFLFIAILVFIFLICSLRTNIVFFTNMFLIELAICLLLGSTWKEAEGDTDVAHRLQVGCGACVFATCILAFYLLFAQLLEAVAFPIDLPVGDLSSRIGRWKRVPKLAPSGSNPNEKLYDV